MDVRAVERAVKMATEQVRASGEPFLLECRTYRFRAHSMYDPELYRSREEVEAWKKRCPIKTFETELGDAGEINETEIAEIEKAIDAEVAEAIAFAEAGPLEPIEDLLKDVYTPMVLRQQSHV
jgi:TPP-dependent pyruvate/acetoin dehydrogenase alpha subunit